MKKLILSFAFFIALAVSHGQTPPNGDCEHWYNVPVNATLNYDQPGTGPTDNYLTTLNDLSYNQGHSFKIIIFELNITVTSSFSAKTKN